MQLRLPLSCPGFVSFGVRYFFKSLLMWPFLYILFTVFFTSFSVSLCFSSSVLEYDFPMFTSFSSPATYYDAWTFICWSDHYRRQYKDKGSGIVILDTDAYVAGLEKEVNIGKSYSKTDDEKHKETEKLVKKTVNKMYKNGHINNDLKKYLTPKLTKPGQLKGNPKLHKKGKPLRTLKLSN